MLCRIQIQNSKQSFILTLAKMITFLLIRLQCPVIYISYAIVYHFSNAHKNVKFTVILTRQEKKSYLKHACRIISYSTLSLTPTPSLFLLSHFTFLLLSVNFPPAVADLPEKENISGLLYIHVALICLLIIRAA